MTTAICDKHWNIQTLHHVIIQTLKHVKSINAKNIRRDPPNLIDRFYFSYLGCLPAYLSHFSRISNLHIYLSVTLLSVPQCF